MLFLCVVFCSLISPCDGLTTCLPLELNFAERTAVPSVKVRRYVMDSSEQAPFVFMWRGGQKQTYKGKVHPRTVHARMPIRGIEVKFYSFFNLGARWGWVVNATPCPVYLRERPGIHCTGGWTCPRPGLARWGKYNPPPAFDPRTVQPIASCYTVWAISAHEPELDKSCISLFCKAARPWSHM
jgi:hypothetical protein